MPTREDRSALNRAQRDSDLAEMTSEPLDVLVIGGGVTGTGAALDAASRGLRVGLVEQRDYGSGTSSRSSKMFHGGLRYLEQFQFGLVREALRERNLMVSSLCPHLVEPASFVYPLKHRIWERVYVGSGVLLYEVLARLARNPLPWHRHMGRKGLSTLAPSLDAIGGVRYWDTVFDDARHTVTLARTAASRGALLSSSVRVVGFDERAGRIRSAEVVDLESGRHLRIEARSVINATGVWTDSVEQLAGQHTSDVHASKGVHIVVPRDRIEAHTGIILRTKASVLFVVPWGAHWIVGTTDTSWSLARAHPAASSSDIDYILKWANTALTTPLERADVVGVYAGLRPLLKGESDETSKLSREHAVLDRGNGLVSVAGGKYTTYRVMARDAVDATAPYIGRDLAESRTAEIPLVGATRPSSDRLVKRYGANAGAIHHLASSDESLATPVAQDAPYLGAEVAYGVSHEGALHIDDILTRRTRMSVETEHRGIAAVEEVARIMARLLDWDDATVNREVEHYVARVEAERDSQRQLDDQTADAARMGAPDVRTGVAE